jgi:hypothetical protein
VAEEAGMNPSEQAIAENETLVPEDYFQKMLINERKRTERFGRPFMLVLLDVSRIFKERWDAKESLLQNLELAINASTREIDLKGWYAHNKLIGILCPEIYKTDKNWIIDKLRHKVKTYLEPNAASSVRIFCLYYPEVEVEQVSGHSGLEIDELRPEWRGFFQS